MPATLNLAYQLVGAGLSAAKTQDARWAIRRARLPSGVQWR
jgi:hypothetical protein